jgi:hypothetical protein
MSHHPASRSWLKAIVFLLISGLFASSSNSAAPFWDFSAGITLIIAMFYAMNALVSHPDSAAELVPIRIRRRRD